MFTGWLRAGEGAILACSPPAIQIYGNFRQLLEAKATAQPDPYLSISSSESASRCVTSPH